MNVDSVFFEIIREGLFDIENHLPDTRMVGEQPVQNVVDVCRVGDGAVKIACQPEDIVFNGNFANFQEPVVVPLGVVAAKFYL